jgi:hypothetical protein
MGAKLCTKKATRVAFEWDSFVGFRNMPLFCAIIEIQLLSISFLVSLPLFYFKSCKADLWLFVQMLSDPMDVQCECPLAIFLPACTADSALQGFPNALSCTFDPIRAHDISPNIQVT